MSVLSDDTIRAKVRAGELISGGDPNCAVHCCYEFTAEVLFRGSAAHAEPVTTQGATIGPSELVWVRAKESIVVPANMVGVWIQTQTLSRQGLLLLNTTLIEPGYEGPLTAVFVNFGVRHVVIASTTRIAKVMFLTLDKDALSRVPPAHQPQYDSSILEVSANAPRTFLQIEQMLPSLERETATRLGQIDQRLQAAHAVLDERLKLAERELLERTKDEVRRDVNAHGRRWLGGLALGFVAASLAVWFAVGVVFPQLVVHYSNLDATVGRAVQIGNAPALEHLRTEIRNSRSELDQLRQKLIDLEKATARQPAKRTN